MPQVWNPWNSNEYYGNFVCVENAQVSLPVRLAPVRAALWVLLSFCLTQLLTTAHARLQGEEWAGCSSLFVRDMLLSASLPVEVNNAEDEEEEDDDGLDAATEDEQIASGEGTA